MESIVNNQKIKTSRTDLLVAVILTAVNIVGFFVGVGFYFPFSVYFPYLTAMYGYISAYPELFDETLAGQGYGEIAIAVGLVMSVVVLGVYVVFYILSRPKAVKTVEQAKRAKGVLIAALVFFALDTLILVGIGLETFDLSSIIDLAFHVWAIVSFVGGIKGYDAAVKEALSPRAVEEADAVVTDTVTVDDNQQS